MKKTPQKKVKIVPHKASALDHGFPVELLGAGGIAGAGNIQRSDEISLAQWAAQYMEQEVVGVQANNTAEAKKRDLTAFMTWYYEANGDLDIANWIPRDTQRYLTYFEKKGRAPTTVNRTLATLRTFARWCHEQDKSPFVGGLPTKGVKELIVEEPGAKKLGKREINRLFKAAEVLVMTEKRKNARPKRNRAILALLYYTGLRVTELCALQLEQYDGAHLVNVKRKGKARTKSLYVPKDCRVYLDYYLQTERKMDAPPGVREWLILAPGGKGMMDRKTVWNALQRLCAQATVHTKDDLQIHPHRLRHTFGFEVRKRTGSDTETAALLGHAGLKHVGRYVRRTDEEREKILEDL